MTILKVVPEALWFHRFQGFNRIGSTIPDILSYSMRNIWGPTVISVIEIGRRRCAMGRTLQSFACVALAHGISCGIFLLSNGFFFPKKLQFFHPCRRWRLEECVRVRCSQISKSFHGSLPEPLSFDTKQENRVGSVLHHHNKHRGESRKETRHSHERSRLPAMLPRRRHDSQTQES